MASPALTRKRSRAHLEGEEDELSPQKVKTIAPLTSAKRKKMNTSGSSPANGGMFGILKRLVSSPWKEKENGTNSDDEDELARADTPEVSNGKRGVPAKDIYDMDVSEPEQDDVPKKRSRMDRRLTSTPKTKAGSEKVSTKSKSTPTDIWEIPEEETSARRSIRKSATSAEKLKVHLAPVAQDDDQEPFTQPSPRRGRPKRQILQDASKLAKQAIREEMLARQTEEGREEEEEAVITPKKRKSGRKAREDTPDSSAPQLPIPTTGMSGELRKVSIEIPVPAKSVPKGILTPRKNRPGRPRKSVVFEEGGDVDLGFKDLPGKKSKKVAMVLDDIAASPNKLEPEEDADPDDEDDIACEICSGPKVTKKNQIVICEKCEYSVHQKCIKLAVIPEGEWLCKGCQPDPEPELEDDAEEDVDTDASDDIACDICSGLDSRARNPIIICDGCDYTVHKKCYGVTFVPRGDWFCKMCSSKKGDDGLFPHLGNGIDLVDNAGPLPNIDGFEEHLRRMQRTLLDKLTGQKRIRLKGYEDEMHKVHQVVEQTVLAGEGNSMLVIGARGSGKTTLVESVISDLSDERENFHVVRLNGFIHTDDKLALKEIWRQLGREMELEDENTGNTNYADTLASLLALLSHPSELSEAQTGQTAKSVIFILDEFDLFTTHSRQTLLYNLFDIAQARKAPIAVLGLTTRIDVVESLEKRVKSRFSHRYVHLSLPRSLPAFWDICKEALTVNTEDPDCEGFDLGLAGQEEFVSYWHDMIEDLYKDDVFKQHIGSLFYRTKSVPEFFTSCILPVASLSAKSFRLTGKIFTSNSLSLSAPDSKLDLLRGLSELELALVIAAARLDIILDTDTCNFAMAYDEYSSLTSRYKIQTSSTGIGALGASAKIWGREVALAAWERLADYGLLVPAAIGGGGGRDFGAGGRMWKVDVGLEEITGSVDGLSGVMVKWCREI